MLWLYLLVTSECVDSLCARIKSADREKEAGQTAGLYKPPRVVPVGLEVLKFTNSYCRCPDILLCSIVRSYMQEKDS